MEGLKEQLESKGVDVEGALRRVMNNEALFIRLLKKIREDTSYQKLQAALADGDDKAAYEAAHTLKGAAGNLGLNPIMDAAGTISDKLKQNDLEGLDEEMKVLDKAYKDIFDILQTIP